MTDNKRKHAAGEEPASSPAGVPDPFAGASPTPAPGATSVPDWARAGAATPSAEPPAPPAAEAASDDTPHITDDDLSRLIASVNEAAAARGAEAGDGAGAPVTDEQRIAQLETQLAERTDDLQRLQAEYVNYKRRVDRDRAVSRQQGATSVIRELIPVLDALAHAEEAEPDMPEGLRIVGAEITRVTAKLGLESFGSPGEEFDPASHEALYQVPTSEYQPMTIAQVIQPGYRLNDQVIRPARVAVAAEPSADQPGTA